MAGVFSNVEKSVSLPTVINILSCQLQYIVGLIEAVLRVIEIRSELNLPASTASTAYPIQLTLT